MENKGLNIFNSRCALANPTVATDADYLRIEGVVGHEYFHNWTGDRVTLRDWFQLTLKEGLTVFRDQEFSADMLGSPSARAVQRIHDVAFLRAAQFQEDAGPMAHPLRPESYQSINNFTPRPFTKRVQKLSACFKHSSAARYSVRALTSTFARTTVMPSPAKPFGSHEQSLGS